MICPAVCLGRLFAAEAGGDVSGCDIGPYGRDEGW